MKQGKALAIGFVILAFVLFFVMRPVREKACPLTQAAIGNAIESECRSKGGVVKDGTCTCPE